MNDELNLLENKITYERDAYEGKIHDLTYSLTNKVRDKVSRYAESKTKSQLDKIMKNHYEDAAKKTLKESFRTITRRR